MPEVSGTAQFWHFISIRCPNVSSFSILWEQTIERGRHQSLEFSPTPLRWVLQSWGLCSWAQSQPLKGTGPCMGQHSVLMCEFPALFPGVRRYSQIRAGKTACIQDKGRWQSWLGDVGTKKQRQQKVQTANKVEGLRRQWRKDLGRFPGWRTHVSFSRLQD